MTPEFRDEIPSPALDSFSNTRTFLPFSAEYFAIDSPTAPAPMIAISKILILQEFYFVYYDKLI